MDDFGAKVAATTIDLSSLEGWDAIPGPTQDIARLIFLELEGQTETAKGKLLSKLQTTADTDKPALIEQHFLDQFELLSSVFSEIAHDAPTGQINPGYENHLNALAERALKNYEAFLPFAADRETSVAESAGSTDGMKDDEASMHLKSQNRLSQFRRLLKAKTLSLLGEARLSKVRKDISSIEFPRQPRQTTNTPPPPRESSGTGGWTVPARRVIEEPKLNSRDMRTFPQELQDRVVLALVEAGGQFRAEMDTVDSDAALLSLRKRWFWHVFLSFGRSARVLVARREWAVAKMHSEGEEFFKIAAKGAGLSHWEPYMGAELRRSPEWGQYERLLLGSLESTANGEVASGEVDMSSNQAIEKLQSWSSLTIRFTSDDRIQIFHNGQPKESLNYAEFGCQDGRNQNPTLSWRVLRALAENEGILKDPPQNVLWPSIEKAVQSIRKLLRARFSVEADPIPFVEGIGYRTEFKIGISKSYQA